jgi:serine/threonine-protein kinase
MAEIALQQLESIFHAALNLPSAERSAYLEDACRGNPELYVEVSTLISALESSDGFLENPIISLGMSVLSQCNQHSLTGKTIGVYRIESLLGKGGMGEVYLAEDTRLERKVALKFLPEALTGDAWAKRQLEKEAQAAAMLDHPNICTVYGFEEVDEYSFIVMQYVEGETLSDLIHERAVQLDQVMDIARQIVGAVAHAHAHGVIHRDLKPKNIMVTPHRQVKVLDFGLAKTVAQPGVKNAAESISQLSQAGVLKGTVAYMSPEQLRGEKLDFRSDVFSLGTVLFELLTGSNPYVHGNTAETVSAILTFEPARSNAALRDTSRDLNRIVGRCMQKNREGRYQSAGELMSELARLPGEVRRLRKWYHGVGFRVAAMVALMVILATVFGYAIKSWNRGVKLAVLPFKNETGDASLDLMQDGFTDSLIARLSKLPHLRVNSFSIVSQYRNLSISPQQVGSELGVDAVLTGRIVKRGETPVMFAQLKKTVDGSEIWSVTYELTTVSPFDLKENLCEQVAAKLNGNGGGGASPPSPETNNKEAYLAFLRGKHYWSNRDKHSIEQAVANFKQSIDLDPAYAEPHAGLADCYVLMNSPAYGGRPTDEVMPLAKDEAQKALKINPELPEALTSLGMIYLKYERNWYKAEEQFKNAIHVKGDYAMAHYWYADLLTVTGRLDEAMTEITLAKKFDPTSSLTRSAFCRQSYYERDYDRAASCFSDLLNDEPDSFSARHSLGYVLIRQGKLNEAVETLQALPDTKKSWKLPALGYALAQAGRSAEAQNILDQVKEMQKQNLVPSMDVGVAYRGMGNKDEIFNWLEKGFAEKNASLNYLSAEPAFDSIRSDPRFISLAGKLNLPVTQASAVARSK